MAKTVITLFVRSDCVTYVATKGKRIFKWAELPLEVGMVKDGLISDPNALGTLIRNFVKGQGVKSKNIIAGLTGLHCLTQTMVLPHVQSSMLPEAIRREAELALPVPLDQLYLSWQIVASTSEAVHVFLAASPRNTADALIQTLDQAGVRLQMIDLAPLALSRLGTGITGVMADIRPTEVDIIVNVDGLPQLIRSQTYPSETKTIQEKLLYVKEELERAIDFYDSAHAEKPLDAAAFSGRLPIHVSGRLVQDLAACQFLAAELNRSVLPFRSTMRSPHDFPATQYMVNVGLASKAVEDDEEDFSGININVLPEGQRPKVFSYVRVATAVGYVVAAVALVLFSATQVRAANARGVSLQQQLDSANTQFEKKFALSQSQKLQAAELTKSLTAAKATRDKLAVELASLNAVSANLNASRLQLNAETALITTAAPAGITLANVNRSGGATTVSGDALDQATVLAYARTLRESGKFSTVVVTRLAGSKGVITFTLTLEERVQG